MNPKTSAPPRALPAFPAPVLSFSAAAPAGRRTFGVAARAGRRTFALAAVLGATLAAAAPGQAITIRVHPDSAAVPNHVATILEANAMVAFGDSIEVSSAGSPYIHTAVMTLVDGVVYRGGFGPDFEGPNTDLYETTIELQLPGGTNDSVIDAIFTGDSAVLAGFTITGGNSSFSAGGMFCGSGIDVTVRNCRFVRNHADVVGGGITLGAGSNALVYNCDFDSCSAGERGGGIAVVGGATGARIEFCRFTACSAATRMPPPVTGGGGGVYTAEGIEITRNTYQSCWSGQDGGAFFALNADGFRCATSWMFDNVAVRNGGAILQDGGSGDYYSLQIERGTAGSNGGAAYFQQGTSSLRESFVRDCVAAAGGGGFYYEEPTASEVTTTEFVNNQAATGGGIQVRPPPPIRSTTLEIRNNSFALNGATDPQAGGGIHIEPAGFFFDLVENNIIAHQVDGAALSCFGALSQPTVSHNLVFNDLQVNTDPPYDGQCDDRTGINGNKNADPRYCDLAVSPPQLSLFSFSPAVGAGTGGVDMGAHQGSSCGVTIQVEPTSWSRIKAYYR